MLSSFFKMKWKCNHLFLLYLAPKYFFPDGDFFPDAFMKAALFLLGLVTTERSKRHGKTCPEDSHSVADLASARLQMKWKPPSVSPSLNFLHSGNRNLWLCFEHIIGLQVGASCASAALYRIRSTNRFILCWFGADILWWMCPRQWRQKRIFCLVYTWRSTTLIVIRAFTGCFPWGAEADTLLMILSGWDGTIRLAPSPCWMQGCPANSWPCTPTEPPTARTCCSPFRTWARGAVCPWTARRWASWRGWTSRTRPWSGSESMRYCSSASLARPRGVSRWSLRCCQHLRPERHTCVCLTWHQSWTQARIPWGISQLNSEHMGPWRLMRLSCVIHDRLLICCCFVVQACSVPITQCENMLFCMS